MRKIRFALGVCAFALYMFAANDYAKADEVYDVTKFGANGSDKSNDREAIQECLKLGNTSEVITVKIPSGTYYIDSDLKIYGNTVLELAEDAIIVAEKNMNHMLYNPSNSIDAPITISGGVWEADKTVDKSSIISIKNCSDLTVKNLTINDNGGYGILVQNCNVDITGCKVNNSYGNAIGVHKGKASISDCKVNNVIYEKANGYYLNGCTKAEIKKCKVSKAGYDGVIANTVKSLTITDCEISYVENCGITTSKCTNVTVQNNIVSNQDRDAIWMENPSVSTILIDNNLVGPSKEGTKMSSGIVVFGGGKIKVSNNEVNDIYHNAIYAKESNDVTIESNTIKKTGKNGICVLKIEGTIYKNDISSTKASGITMNSTTGVKVVSNKFTNIGDMGVYAYKGSNTSYIGNTLNNIKGHGLDVFSTKNAVIKKNSVKKSKKMGIYAKNVTGLKIMNNDVVDTATRPIRATECSGTITKNVCRYGNDGTPIIGEGMKISSNKQFKGTPSFTKVTKRNTNATLKWKKAEGVTGYQIYARVGNAGKWKKIKTVSGANVRTIKCTKLKSGKKHKFKIRAYIKGNTGTIYTDFSKVK
ncbi:MAG: right-handed parallel beta-helix repeat-containing protein [Lachnospiraceae bacterium]|nr:right-handed parallel beta-helix repeat-containing protein [Lachnospiraceae bacterium]